MRRMRAASCTLTLVCLILAGCTGSPQARRDRYLARGKQFLDKGDAARALLEFKNAAKAVNNDPEVYYRMGTAFEAAHDLRGAVAAYRQALDTDPRYSPAQLRYAEILAQTDEPELLKEAQDRLKGLVERGQEDRDVLHALAFTELKLGDFGSATQNLERALAGAPTDLTASLLLARAKLGENDQVGAEAILKKACENAPRSPDPLRILAEFYIGERQYPQAEAQLNRALQVDSKSGPALLDLARLQLTDKRTAEAGQNFKRLAGFPGYSPIYGVFLFQEGRYEDSLREFEKVVRQNPEDRESRSRLVLAYRLTNHSADAEKVLATALRKNSNDADALLQRAEISLGAGRHADAEKDLNQVIHLQPTAAEAHYVLGKLFQATGQTLRYKEQLYEALRLNSMLVGVRAELAQNLANSGDPRAALEVLNGAPASQRSALPLLVQRNWASWALGDLSEMRKGIDLGLSQVRAPDLLIQDALYKMRAGDTGHGRAVIEEALKINPADLRALQALAQSYTAEHKPSEALQKVREYAARQPKSAPIQLLLGLTLLANGDRQGARAAFDAAKSADPQFTEADLSLVQLDVVESKIDDAIRRLQTLTGGRSEIPMARLWLADLDEVKGEHNAAIGQFRKAVEANPRDADAANNLAYLLIEYTDHSDEALNYAQKAVELAPGRPAYLDTLGWVLYKKGLYPSAIRYLEKASADPGNAVWKYHLAMAYAKAGDFKRGRSVLNAALRVDPKVPEAKLAQQVLNVAP